MIASGTQRQSIVGQELESPYAPRTVQQRQHLFCNSSLVKMLFEEKSAFINIENKTISFALEETEIADLLTFFENKTEYQRNFMQDFLTEKANDKLFWFAVSKMDRSAILSALDVYLAKSGLMVTYCEGLIAYSVSKGENRPGFNLLEPDDQASVLILSRILSRRFLGLEAQSHLEQLTEQNDNDWVDVASELSTTKILQQLSKDDLPEVKIHHEKNWGAKSAPELQQPSLALKIKPYYFQYSPKTPRLFSFRPVNISVDANQKKQQVNMRMLHPRSFGPAK